MTPSSRRLLLGLATGLAAPTLSGCAIPARNAAVPRGQATRARALGLPNERFLLPMGTALMEEEIHQATLRRMRHLGITRARDLPPFDLLGVSGGGEDGAFGAGLLCGWTEHGGRPTFELVTGVSTGSLTAPFAFLGPEWDGALRGVYTDITPADVLRSRWLTAALFNDAMADTTPLFHTISRYLDDRMLAAIGRGYEEGRLLLVGTSNLDAQLPVIWNIGAIAASGHPGALALIRRLLLASAAVPGAFPPVMLEVEADGVRYQEMHVDGGAFTQVFLYPAAVTAPRRERLAHRQAVTPTNAYIIRNARLDPSWASVDRRTISIASRAIATMIAASGYNDILRIYNAAARDRIDFNLAFIGPDFPGTYTTPFEQSYMRELFAYGYERARRGYDWAKRPPI